AFDDHGSRLLLLDRQRVRNARLDAQLGLRSRDAPQRDAGQRPPGVRISEPEPGPQVQVPVHAAWDVSDLLLLASRRDDRDGHRPEAQAAPLSPLTGIPVRVTVAP